MTTKSKSSTSDTELHQLFVDELRDILWAEKHLLKALQKMSKLAKSKELSAAFSSHRDETEVQIQRLGQIFDSLGLAARSKKCHAMVGLLEEGDELAEEYADSSALDAALIAAAQKVEHYEIATYGTLLAFSDRLGYSSASKLLKETLIEESKADEKLTAIATGKSNEEALI